MSEPARDEKAIFLAALEKGTAAERAAYLQRACRGDPAMLARIQELLASHEGSLGPLDAPPVVNVAPTVAPAIAEKPGDTIGPYKLLQMVGEGGMGVVYMAEQTEPVERRVALKIIKPGMDTRQVIARFEAERQALAMMDHPNIAKVLDAGTTDSGRPYFVMELVNGIPVTQYCDEQHLTAQQRLELFIPICQAVQHAHQKGIIHRDLKPSNILVALYDGRPVPKVIDFGVAKAISQRLTEKTMFTGLGQIVGTLEYMSPEQAQRNQLDIDTRSDVYSLGVVLYELLTGDTPFDRRRLRSAAFDEMLRILREEEPPKPSTRLSGSASLPSVAANRHAEPRQLATLVRGELDWIVMKALEKDRGRRYETASSFADDVQRYLNDEAVAACPPSAAYKLRKFARRNKAVLTTTSVIALTLLLAVGAVGWMVRDRAARQQQAARQREARQTRLAGQIALILGEVDRLMAEHRWQDALAAARRAEAALQSGGADAATRQRVEQVLADLQLVQALEEARLRESRVRARNWDRAGAEREYGRAFRQAGINVDGLTVEAAAAPLWGRRRILPELAAGLTEWSRLRRMLDKNDARWQHLLAVADAIDPDPWRCRLRAAWKLDSAERKAETLQQLADAADVTQLPRSTITLLGRLLYDGVSPQAAARLLRKAQQQHPDDFWINFDLGECLASSAPGGSEEAVGFLRAAQALRPGTGVANNLGFALMDQGKLDEAVASVRKAMEWEPQDAMAHNNLGTALRRQGKREEAIACFRTAIELDPSFALAHRNLARILVEQGKLNEAEQRLRNLIALDPTHAPAHSDLGAVLERQGRRGEAIPYYRRATELAPKEPLPHSNLGVALTHDGKWEAAEEPLRRAVELDPENAEAHYNLGVDLAQQRQLGEAVACFRKAVEFDPSRAMAHYNLGFVLLQMGKPDEAETPLRRAIELDPENADAHKALRIVLRTQAKRSARNRVPLKEAPR